MQKILSLEVFKKTIVYSKLVENIKSYIEDNEIDNFLLFMNSKRYRYNMVNNTFYNISKRNIPLDVILEMYRAGTISIGDDVIKLNKKPFKSGLKIQTVKGFCLNPHDPNSRLAVLFNDDSCCNVNLVCKYITR